MVSPVADSLWPESQTHSLRGSPSRATHYIKATQETEPMSVIGIFRQLSGARCTAACCGDDGPHSVECVFQCPGGARWTLRNECNFAEQNWKKLTAIFLLHQPKCRQPRICMCG